MNRARDGMPRRVQSTATTAARNTSRQARDHRAATTWPKRFALPLANVWPAQHSQTYPELARLQDMSWIRQSDQGPRARKVYESTLEGIGALRDWLTGTDRYDRKDRSIAPAGLNVPAAVVGQAWRDGLWLRSLGHDSCGSTVASASLAVSG